MPAKHEENSDDDDASDDGDKMKRTPLFIGGAFIGVLAVTGIAVVIKKRFVRKGEYATLI